MIHEQLQRKIDDSKEVLKVAAAMSKEYYKKPLIITYSGGKDSDVILQLAIETLDITDFEVFNSHTTVDAPETVYYIRDKFKKLESMGIKTTIHYPHNKDGTFKSIWSMIVDKQIPPTRFARYCCKELKETSTPNRFVATGVRAAESQGRKGRDVFTAREKLKKDAKYYTLDHVKEVFNDDLTRRERERVQSNEIGVWDCVFITKAKEQANLICNPIYKWADKDVWQFIDDRGMEHNPLYDKGFCRVGCIGCPFAGYKTQREELEMYPKYKLNYIRAFDRMLERRRQAGKDDVTGKDGIHRWTDGEAVYRWWINDTSIQGQMSITDYEVQDND